MSKPHQTGKPQQTGKPKSTQGLDRWGTLNQFADERLAEITQKTGSASAGLLWFVLFRHANGKSGKLQASSRWLEVVSGLSRPTVRLALKQLIAAELVQRVGSHQNATLLLVHQAKSTKQPEAKE